MDGYRAAAIRLAFFGHNRNDAAIVRRALGFSKAGVEVTGVMYRRDGAPEKPAPEWSKIDLGHIEHCEHAKRILSHIKAAWRVLINRSSLRDMDVFYARNLDMLALSFLGLPILGGRTPRVVYECLDVHDALTHQNLKGAVLRWLERRALKRVDLLVISSPGFLKKYFGPYQSFRGPTYLLENKLYFEKEAVPRPDPMSVSEHRETRLIVAWVGILRCQRTLDLLKQLASSEQDRVLIRLHGTVSDFLIRDFESQIAPFPNIVYFGQYRYPEGLADAYSGVHFVWAQELSWSGHNSDWLIPNRVYEGSYFGALSLAVEGSETAQLVAERKLGYVLPDSRPETLIQFIRDVSYSDVASKRRALLTRSPSEFVAGIDEIDELLDTVVSAAHPAAKGPVNGPE
jgi:succinoglycan biosynthesis protein ExoL